MGPVVVAAVAVARRVRANSSVVVIFESAPPGAQLATVPRLAGRTRPEARSALEAVGLTLRERGRCRDGEPVIFDGDACTVERTAPAAGARIPRGDPVTTTFAGPAQGEQATVPDVARLRLADVRKRLGDAGIELTTAGSCSVDPPPVFDAADCLATGSDPAPGTRVEPGSTVTVPFGSVRRDATDSTVPDVRGLSVDDALAKLKAAGLVGSPSGSCAGDPTGCSAVGSSPAAGERLPAGSSVVVNFLRAIVG